MVTGSFLIVTSDISFLLDSSMSKLLDFFLYPFVSSRVDSSAAIHSYSSRVMSRMIRRDQIAIVDLWLFEKINTR